MAYTILSSGYNTLKIKTGQPHRGLLCNCRQGIHAIPRDDSIPSCMPAHNTFLHNHLVFPLLFYCYRLHKPSTSRRTVTRMYIDVFTPQTLRAMIGISIPLYYCSAFFAYKILYFLLKRLRHASTIHNFYEKSHKQNPGRFGRGFVLECLVFFIFNVGDK